MDIKQLEYFIVVAEELNITRASKILLMSQPPLSNQMKNLEEEIGAPLFIRGKRNLTLTKEGQYLYQKSKDIVSLVEKTKSELIAMGKGLKGTISIGLVEGMAPNIAARWFTDFMAQNPGVKFRILDGNSDDLIEKMRSGIISLAVISSPFDQNFLNSFKVGEEKMVALMNNSHPLAMLEDNKIDIDLLKNEPLIVPSRKAHVEAIKRWFRKLKVEPNIVCEMDNYLDAAALANQGVGVSIFPKTSYVLNNSLVSKELTGDDKKVEYYLVWRKGHLLPTIEENFIDFVKGIYKI